MDEVPKGWGKELWITNTPLYCGKKLLLHKGKQCSLHYHKIKDETFFVQSGTLRMELRYPDGRREERTMRAGDSLHLPPRVIHRFTGIEDCEIFEFSTQHFEEDSYRIEPGDSQHQEARRDAPSP